MAQRVLMTVVMIVMLTGWVSAQEVTAPCEPSHKAQVTRGARGPVGPAGPQGLPGTPAQIPSWYLAVGVAGMFFGLLGTGLAFGAMVARPYPPQATQPVNVFNNIPGPGGNPTHR